LRQRRKSRRSNVVIAFGLTLGLLVTISVVGAVLSPTGNGVATKHIPSSFPPYSGLIGQFAPSDAVQVSYNNFTAIRLINASALQQGNYLVFTHPELNVSVTAVEQRISVTLTKPNATVDITVLDGSIFASASEIFNSSNAPRSISGSHVLFLATGILNQTTIHTWVAFVPREDALLISLGNNIPKDAIQTALSVYDDSVQSLISAQGIQRMLYAANGTAGHLGIGIQNFVGAVQTGQATLITVDRTGLSLALNYFVSFANSSQAQSQIRYFQHVYLGSEKFVSYDEILSATEYQPVSSLSKAIIVVG
jgi:hypothetical protein